MTHEIDETFMSRAIELARRGAGRTAPNPPVGCVLVRDQQIIGEGWHKKAGEAHAEADALAQCPVSTLGATAYVTLEPCNHTGRTPPCAAALVQAGIERIVIGSIDPNPNVTGGGVERLRAAGLDVRTGVLQEQSDSLIAPFSHWLLHKRPLVTLKVATSLDGRIATMTGHSQWVTGEEARLDVHQRRNETDAILVGSGTVRADDPRLTTRLPNGEGRDPIRVVVSNDPKKLPANARILNEACGAATILVTHQPITQSSTLTNAAVEVWTVNRDEDGVSLRETLNQLGERNIQSLLVEGGQQIATSFLKQGLVDRIVCYIAPKIIGGDGREWAGALGFRTMNAAIRLENVRIQPMGSDVCIEGDCVYGDSRR